LSAAWVGWQLIRSTNIYLPIYTEINIFAKPNLLMPP